MPEQLHLRLALADVAAGAEQLRELATTLDRWPGATPTQRARTAMGTRHPMGWAVPGPEGATCGTCGHCRRRLRAVRVYLKCDLVRSTAGQATDTRARWPACARWTVRQVEASSSSGNDPAGRRHPVSGCAPRSV